MEGEDEIETVVIVPDIQYYTNNEQWTCHLDSITSYINKNSKEIPLVMQVGDITHYNQEWQWVLAYDHFFSKIKNNRIVFCLGNHDYGDYGQSEERITRLNFSFLPNYDISMDDAKENYVVFADLFNNTYAVLVLEFAPRTQVLDWANKVIKENPFTRFIILTHAFLNNEGMLFDYTDALCDNKYSQKYYEMGGDYLNDSKEVFDHIVYHNPNVKMVICGHCLHPDFITMIDKKNANGKNVHCLMVNFQHAKEGGQGNIAIWSQEGDIFYIRTYSTSEHTWGDKAISFNID